MNNKISNNFIPMTNSNNSSNCSHSLSKSQISNNEEKNKKKHNEIPIEKIKIKEKLKQYKKLLDKKMKDITRNKSCKTNRCS